MGGARRIGRRYAWLAVVPALVALILSQQFSAAQARSQSVHAARFPLSQGRWQLRLNSLFTGSSLPTAWSDSRFDNGEVAAGFNPYELECFDPLRVKVGGGSLALRVVKQRELCNGHWQKYSSGIASTVGRWTFRYGLLEARIWVPSRGSKIVDWPAVWMGGSAEIDLFEGGRVPCWYYHVDHRRWGRCLDNVHITNGWHTVAVNWERGSITWYYDRRKVASVSSRVAPITSKPKSILLDLAISHWRAEPRVAPATFRISWVRVWQHSS